MSNESRFDVDLSLGVKEILRDVVVLKKSVMEEGWDEEVDGGGEANNEWDNDEGADGHIIVPIWGSTYGQGAISITNLTLFRPKTLRKSRNAETREERDVKGLEVRRSDSRKEEPHNILRRSVLERNSNTRLMRSVAIQSFERSEGLVSVSRSGDLPSSNTSLTRLFTFYRTGSSIILKTSARLLARLSRRSARRNCLVT